jgi:hypothetical protein
MNNYKTTTKNLHIFMLLYNYRAVRLLSMLVPIYTTIVHKYTKILWQFVCVLQSWRCETLFEFLSEFVYILSPLLWSVHGRRYDVTCVECCGWRRSPSFCNALVCTEIEEAKLWILKSSRQKRRQDRSV